VFLFIQNYGFRLLLTCTEILCFFEVKILGKLRGEKGACFMAENSGESVYKKSNFFSKILLTNGLYKCYILVAQLTD
jgi:hypothetical protein